MHALHTVLAGCTTALSLFHPLGLFILLAVVPQTLSVHVAAVSLSGSIRLVFNRKCRCVVRRQGMSSVADTANARSCSAPLFLFLLSSYCKRRRQKTTCLGTGTLGEAGARQGAGQGVTPACLPAPCSRAARSLPVTRLPE